MKVGITEPDKALKSSGDEADDEVPVSGGGIL